MLVGVLREAGADETRVAVTPSSLAKIAAGGHEVVIESEAGRPAGFDDAAYLAAGATIGDACTAQVVIGVNPPARHQLDRLTPGTVLVSVLEPRSSPSVAEDLAARGLTALALDAVPRISRAQSLDVLSSMANIAGYRAVVEAAHSLGRPMSGQVTAAGKSAPARLLVVGCGVAGLSAIGTAQSMGAIVQATDPRPEVADQVRSLGGTYLPVDREPADETVGSASGYAQEVSQSYAERAARLYAEHVPESDVLITTALVPGKPAPRLVTAEMLAHMRPGSVVVDLAAANGGNVEGTVPNQIVRTDEGVTIIGDTQLAARLPAHASELWGTNIANLLDLLTTEPGTISVDLDDVVQRSMTVAHEGRVTWPPPPVPVAAATTRNDTHSADQSPTPEVSEVTAAPRFVRPLAGLGIVLVFAATLLPQPMPRHITVLTLSVIIGYYVIGKVHHALHTPLMSVTNAISGVVVVGAMLQLDSDSPTLQATAAAAVLLASINVFGGFAVTRRMLGMFARS